MSDSKTANLVEAIDFGGKRYAEVIRADARVTKTTFFSPGESSFQFGLLAHEAGFVEAPHYHQPFSRTIDDLQQMFVVQRGVVAVELYADDGSKLREVILRVWRRYRSLSTVRTPSA